MTPPNNDRLKPVTAKNQLQSHPSQPGHFFAGPQQQQALNRRFHEIDRVGAAVGLGQDVLNAAGFQDISDTRAGFHTGSGTCWDQDHPAASKLADHAVGNGGAAHLNSRLAAQGLLSVLGGFFHGGRNLVGLAVAPGHSAMLIADDHEGIKAKAPAAFNHCRAPPNLYHSFFNAVRPGFTISRHEALPMLKIPGRILAQIGKIGK
jgi:hypothetical protein